MEEIKITSGRGPIYSLDLFKGIAAVLVVCIHMHLFKSHSESLNYYWVQGICRIAVPFFFICNGYFWRDFTGAGTYRTIKRLFCLYIIWTIIYLPIFFDIWKSNDIPIGRDIKEFIYKFIFTSTLTHFWYFPATISALFIIWSLKRYLTTTQIVICTFFLHIIGILGDAHYGFIQKISVLEKYFEIYFDIFTFMRNGVFFGTFYIVIGVWFREKALNIKRGKCILGLALSMICMYLEISFLRHRITHGMSMYFSLIPASVFLFAFLLNSQCKAWEGWWRIRVGSVLVFCSHVLFREIMNRYYSAKGIVVNNLMQFVIVVILSLMFSVLVLYFEFRKKWTWLKLLH